MPKFVLTYVGGGMPETEEEGKAVMDAWTTWLAGLGSGVVDGGNPIVGIKAIAPDGSVSDDAPAPVNGYSILEAESVEAAIEMARGCPHLSAGGTVQVGAVHEM